MKTPGRRGSTCLIHTLTAGKRQRPDAGPGLSDSAPQVMPTERHCHQGGQVSGHRFLWEQCLSWHSFPTTFFSPLALNIKPHVLRCMADLVLSKPRDPPRMCPPHEFGFLGSACGGPDTWSSGSRESFVGAPTLLFLGPCHAGSLKAATLGVLRRRA